MSTTAACPSCGAPVEFAIGSSIVVVCTYCRSAVARNDRGVENLGHVAALIDTGSPLRTGLAGKFRGHGFRITGRTQMRHQAGGVWDEWYAAFDDGRWGWVAEAQGRYYVTFATKADAPPHETLNLGDAISDVGNLVVNEIGTAQLASAEGEIPWRAEPNASYDYADLTGTDGKFATIDYSEEPPLVFAGHEATLAQLGLESLEATRKRITATSLNCPNCGGPIDIRMPEQTERIYCPNCGSGIDEQNGKFQLLRGETQTKRVEPVIPLGTTGTIDGVPYVVAGFMERSVHFDIDYFWTEYLLFNREAGFRWLVHSDGHWSFVQNVPAGEVTDRSEGKQSARWVEWNGRTYKLFQDAVAEVTYVVGEFYWRVKVGERVATADYIAPPHGLSREVTMSGAREVNYSHAVYMTPREVAKAFNVKNLPPAIGVGPLQPYKGPRVLKPYGIFLGLLVLIAIIGLAVLPDRTVHSQSLFFADAPALSGEASGAPETARTFFTQPFQLDGKHNVVIEASADVDNSWAWIGGELVNEASGLTERFEIPLEYYHGVDQGESWQEGSHRGRVFISAPPAGTYSLRMEAQWEKANGPSIQVNVREGVFHFMHLVIAFAALTVLAILGLYSQFSFEAARWKDSAYNPYSTGS
ncbi:MAG TPA: DUF4178 domain-containing protein [Thermoanaerobaculia bacterium]|nr:DUF4178 domain-containing protein [Thermoanaerobaculia bacterium]